MTAHDHPAAGHLGTLPAAVAVLVVAAAYLLAARRLRRRGDAWPRARDASFAAGGAGLAAAIAVPLPGAPFTAHMAQHLVLGMAAPLLLVLARPLTLALRTLRPGRARQGLLAAAHSRFAGGLVCPPAAVLIDLGGLWLLYRTPLFAAAQDHAWLHAAVHLHVVAAGTLLAFAVCRLDPVRARWGLGWRAGALLAAGAAHGILAKTLYAAPPPGTAFTAADLHAGAQLMYYGGDVAELALATVVAVQWYAATGRAQASARRRTAAVS